MIQKRLLVADRVRRPPSDGFSWIDRRFLREYAPRLPGDAILLYFFLTAVSDRQGLSFYGDATIAVRLRLTEQHVAQARDELLTLDLIAYQPPLTQVLSVPRPQRIERGGVSALGELFGGSGASARRES